MLVALVLFSTLAQPPTARSVTLTLPHALREGETAFLSVTIGVIQRGAEIEITSVTGRFLGTILPYGIRPGNGAGTYTVPLPSDAIKGRRVTVLLSLRANGKNRVPTKKEVKRVRVGVSSPQAEHTLGTPDAGVPRELMTGVLPSEGEMDRIRFRLEAFVVDGNC